MLLYVVLSASGLIAAECLSLVMRQDSRARLIILLGWAARNVALVLLILAGGGDHYLRAADATNYHNWAQYLLSVGGNAQQYGLPVFTNFVALLYKTLGIDPNLVDIVHSAAGVLTIPLLCELSTRVGGKKAGHLAAWMLALYPSHILWSVSGTKDIWVVFGTVMTAYLLVGIESGNRRAGDWPLFVVGLLLIAYLRFQYVLSIAIAVLGATAMAAQNRKRRDYGNAFMAAVLAVTIAASTMGQKAVALVRQLRTEEAWERSQEIAFAGGSGIRVLALVPARFRWVAQFPFALLAPFPWQWLTIGTGTNQIAAVETAITYLMIFVIVVRGRMSKSIPGVRALLSYALANVLAVSFSLPNLGSIHRYRAPAVVLLIAAAASLATNRAQSRLDGRSVQTHIGGTDHRVLG